MNSSPPTDHMNADSSRPENTWQQIFKSLFKSTPRLCRFNRAAHQVMLGTFPHYSLFYPGHLQFGELPRVSSSKRLKFLRKEWSQNLIVGGGSQLEWVYLDSFFENLSIKSSIIIIIITTIIIITFIVIKSITSSNN